MKRKYLAVALSLSMVFSVVSPVMASSDEIQIVEENSEDTLTDDESEASVSLEEDTETVETDADEEQDDFEIAQFSDADEGLGDGSETMFTAGDVKRSMIRGHHWRKNPVFPSNMMKVVKHYILNVREQRLCQIINNRVVLHNGH